MSDFKAQQRVRLNNGTDDFGFVVTKPFFVTLSDGTDSAMDTANDAVRVNIVAGSTSGTEFAEDAAHTTGDLGTVGLVVRKDVIGSNVDADGDYATLLQDANGRLYVQIHDGGNSITVDNTTLSVVGGGTEATALRVTIANDSTGVLSIDDNGGSITVDGTVTVTATDLDIRDITHVSDSIKVGDGTDFLAVNADGSINAVVTATDLDIRNLTLALDAVKISGNTSANSETNPIFVQVVDTVVSGEEIQNYDTSSAVAVDATDNHDYTVAGTTFLLKSIIVAASGAMKIELQTGPVASLVTRAVGFTSAASPTLQLTFNPPIEVPSTSTGTIRIIRRNDDNQAQDVYSTIIGFDV